MLVDTSVWFLALRRSPPPRAPEVVYLQASLVRGDIVVTSGLILQELLQGFQGPTARKRIIKSFSLLPVLAPMSTIISRPQNCAICAGARESRSGRLTP